MPNGRVLPVPVPKPKPPPPSQPTVEPAAATEPSSQRGAAVDPALIAAMMQFGINLSAGQGFGQALGGAGAAAGRVMAMSAKDEEAQLRAMYAAEDQQMQRDRYNMQLEEAGRRQERRNELSQNAADRLDIARERLQMQQDREAQRQTSLSSVLKRNGKKQDRADYAGDTVMEQQAERPADVPPRPAGFSDEQLRAFAEQKKAQFSGDAAKQEAVDRWLQVWLGEGAQ